MSERLVFEVREHSGNGQACKRCHSMFERNELYLRIFTGIRNHSVAMCSACLDVAQHDMNES